MAKRKTAVASFVPKFSYFNFHRNFSCQLSVYINVSSVCNLQKKSILFYSILYPTFSALHTLTSILALVKLITLHIHIYIYFFTTLKLDLCTRQIK